MTGRELEARLRAQGGNAWREYKRQKEGFIARVIEDNFKAGKRVTRREAQQLWDRRLARQLDGALDR